MRMRRYGSDSCTSTKAEASQAEAKRRRALVALGAALFCGVGGSAYGVMSRLGDAGLPAVTGMLKGRIVFGEPSGTSEEVSPGQGLLQVVRRRDVVESVDLGRRGTYSVRLWPGAYMLRVGAESPAGSDDVCGQIVRIRAGHARRAIIHCTPLERSANLRSRA